MNATVAKYRKFVVSLVGVAGVVLAQGVVTGTAAHWLTVAISVAASLGVVAVPNAQTEP